VTHAPLSSIETTFDIKPRPKLKCGENRSNSGKNYGCSTVQSRWRVEQFSTMLQAAEVLAQVLLRCVLASGERDAGQMDFHHPPMHRGFHV
jgi:hypothetical protein